MNLMCCSWWADDCDYCCLAITSVIVTTSSFSSIVVHCLHGSVEITFHIVDGCCEVDVV